MGKTHVKYSPWDSVHGIFMPRGQKHMKTPWRLDGTPCEIVHGFSLQIGPSFIIHGIPCEMLSRTSTGVTCR